LVISPKPKKPAYIIALQQFLGGQLPERGLMALPRVADSLAGRMETLTLLPLSQSEIEGRTLNWLDGLFSGQLPQPGSEARTDNLMHRVLQGGYPEMLLRTTPRRRVAWARQYLDAIMARDVRELSGIEKLDQLPRFLRALAHTAGQVCYYTQLGAQVGLDGKTAARYMSVFEQMYLLKRVDPWAGNRLKRVVKAPKLQFLDSGLLAMLLNLTEEEIQKNRARFGHVLETFAYAELLKHTTTAQADYHLMYYRDADKVEVDIVIENAAGQLVGVEVKASATVTEADLRGLRKLAGLAGDSFSRGVILYDGDETLPLGDRICAAPLSTLWGQ
jgi:predicted AAA+ superfamily ATPase